jgi:allophanate hydrolase
MGRRDVTALVGGERRVLLAVFGAHLRGQPLNRQLLVLGAEYVEDISTSDAYRLVALDTAPPKPGLVRCGPGRGARIAGELWCIPAVGLGLLLADLPMPMSLTRIELADDREVVGFGCAQDAAAAGSDVTEYGDWREYLRSGLRTRHGAVAIGT